MLLTEISEAHCYTNRGGDARLDRNLIKVDYLKKEIKDLQSDLQDLETTLKINKNIINSLLDPENTTKTLKLMKEENESLFIRNNRLVKDRTALKDEILLCKQLNNEQDSKIKEIQIDHEMEISRLIDQNERKEYNLQFLEQRLVDIERFLRTLGRNDPFLKEQLMLIKINPNLNKKRITSVVEENSILKKQLKESYDKIEELERYTKTLISEPKCDRGESVGYTQDTRENSNISIPKLDFSQLKSKNTKFSRYFNNPREFADGFDLTQDHTIKTERFIDLKKYKILADSFPEEYQKKLETQIGTIQEENIELQRKIGAQKKKIIRLTSEIDSKEFTNEKLVRLVERLQKQVEEYKCHWEASQEAQNRVSDFLPIYGSQRYSIINNQNIRDGSKEPSRISDFGNMSSIVYNLDDLKNNETQDYDNLNEHVLKDIHPEIEEEIDLKQSNE